MAVVVVNWEWCSQVIFKVEFGGTDESSSAYSVLTASLCCPGLGNVF